jgi:hypothetical protein
MVQLVKNGWITCVNLPSSAFSVLYIISSNNHLAFNGCKEWCRWIGFRLDVLAATTLLASALLAVASVDRVQPALLALALTHVLQMTGYMQWCGLVLRLHAHSIPLIDKYALDFCFYGVALRALLATDAIEKMLRRLVRATHLIADGSVQ